MPRNRGAAVPALGRFGWSPARPYYGSHGILTEITERSLRHLGYLLTSFYERHWGDPFDFMEWVTPLRNARRSSRIARHEPARVTFYLDTALDNRPPRRGAGKNVLLLQELMFNPGIYLGNDAIDRYVANSKYTADVLTSLLSFPDWERGRCLDPRAFDAVRFAPNPVPCVDRPRGYAGLGDPMPAKLRAALSGRDIIGHAVQQRMDFGAVYSILHYLDALARERGLGRRFRLVIHQDEWPRLQLIRRHASHKVDLEKLVIPVPRLRNTDLIRLFKGSAFGLSYNHYAEPFGLYVMESVHSGCPVYTNGIGNNRYLLPAEHGVRVHETEGMSFGHFEDYRTVAERIYQQGAGSGADARACLLGRALIERNHSEAAFTRALGRALEGLGAGPRSTPFEALVVGVGPLVRNWNRRNGRVLSDVKTRRLGAAANALACELVGMSAPEVTRRYRRRLEEVETLFVDGILALNRPPGR